MNRKGIVFIFVAVLFAFVAQGIAEAVDKIYWTDVEMGEIQRTNLDGKGVVEDLVTGLENPRGLALDVSNGKMYWINGQSWIGAGLGKIQRTNLDGKGVVEDLVTGLKDSLDIALDVSNGKIYWTEPGKIWRTNLEGKRDIENLVTVTGLKHPLDIALDVSNGKIYWADGFRIQRTNLNGKGVVEVHVAGLNRPGDIALDVSNGKIYWIDKRFGKIQRTNLEGNRDVEDLVAGLTLFSNGLTLDLSNRKMYWTDIEADGAGQKIRCANLDGKGVVEDLVTGLDAPSSIALGFGIPDSRRPDPDDENPPVLSPDLVVERPRVSKLTLAPGESFKLSAKVRNIGSGQSASTTLRYYRSRNIDISTDKTRVGTPVTVSTLGASRTSDKSVTLKAPSTTGTYYYGACVQAVTNESNTRNNCSPVVSITVQRPVVNKPDLIVELLGDRDRTLSPGESFALSARVKNRGEGQSNSTRLRYYRSSNATISRSDTEVGNPDRVSALGANRSNDESVTLTAPDAPGTYHYGACVEAVANESDTGNNCSDSVKITVELPWSERPDLVVQLPWVENVRNRTVVPGESFKFGVTVRNIGRGQSPPTTLRYYLSTDKNITRDDTEVDTDSVGRLARNGKNDESVTLTAPDTPGTYYYGACVESVAYESDTGNNCSTGFEITVSATDDHANTRDGATKLEVIDVALRGPNRIEVGNDVDYFQLIVKGNGQLTVETTGNLDTRGVLEDSSGTTLATGDDEGGGNNFRIQHRVTSGTYYLKVESYGNDTGEYTLKASRSASNLVPDLVVRAPSVSESTLSPGESFRLSAIVANVGRAASGNTTLRWYRSTNADISTDGTPVGTTNVGGLNIPLRGGSTSTESLTRTVPTTPGTYYYWACVDRVTNENTTDNNCSTAVRVTVRAAVASKKSDLVVRAPSVSESTLSPGESFRLSATVVNVGRAASDSTTLRWYRSTDEDISTDDTLVGTTNVGRLNIPLRGNSTSTESLTRTAPTTPDIYYYGACVNSVPNESDTRNNCSTAVRVIVESVVSTDDHGDTAADATSLALDSSLAGEIEAGADVDYFEIEVNGPGILIVHTTGSLDTFGELHDSSDARLTNNDSSGNGRNFRIKHAVTAGTYYIRVSSHDVDTGAYTLHARFVADERVEVRQFMYWTSRVDGIQRANLDGSARDPFFSTETPIDIALDVAGEQIYWTDTNDRIQRANLDGTGTPELIISREDFPNPENSLSFGAIALDVLNNKMYWVVHPEEIWWANLDGSNPDRLLTTKNPYLFGLDTEPTDIALDVRRNDIYWSEFSNFRTRIWRADLNGDNRQMIIDLSHWSHEIHGIALDVTSNKIYWTNSEGPSIWYANTLTADPELLIDLPERGIRGSLRRPYDIALDVAGEQIYWTYVIDAPPDIHGYGIARANIEGFGEPEILFTYAPKDSSMGKVRRDGLLRIDLGVSAMLDANLIIAGALAPNVPWSRVQETALLPNYPNPFNPETWIPYQLATPADVALTIYDIHGRVVRVLDFGYQQAGIYQSHARAAHWDGKNAQGEPVASGVYFYTLRAGDFSATRKMLIRK